MCLKEKRERILLEALRMRVRMVKRMMKIYVAAAAAAAATQAEEQFYEFGG